MMNELLDKKGSYIFKYTKRGQPRECVVSQQDIELFKSIDMRKYCESIPFETRVCWTHGPSDKRVPPSTCKICYAHCKYDPTLASKCDHGYKVYHVATLYSVFKGWYLRDGELHAQKRLLTITKGRL